MCAANVSIRPMHTHAVPTGIHLVMRPALATAGWPRVAWKYFAWLCWFVYIRLIPVFKTFWHVLPSLHIGLAEQLQFEGLIVPNETQSLLICHGCGHLIKDFGKLVAKDVQACYEQASQASFTEFVVSQLISHLKPAKTCTMRVKVDPHNLYQYLRMQWYKSKQPLFAICLFEKINFNTS